MQLKKYKLSDVAKTGSGGTPTSTRKEYYEGGTIPWINSGELSQPFIKQTNNYITELGYKSSSTKIYPQNDTVLLAMYGATAGKASLLQMDACTNQAICAIVPNKEIISPLFLKYKFDTIYSYLVGISTGSARDNLSQTGIANLSLSFPSIEEQNRIASILYSFDQKISLNHAINQNLEALAKQLYDYWFVQFDFPDENGRPYKSSGGKMKKDKRINHNIPENWTVRTVQEIENHIITGKTPSTTDATNFGGDIPFITIDDIRKAVFVYVTERTLTIKGANTQANKYLPKGSLCCSCIGTTGIIGFVGKKGQTNQQINSIIFNAEENKEFVYFALKLHFQFAKAKTGNILPNMNKDEFANILIVYPPKDVLAKFHNIAKDIFSAWENNVMELNELIKQRNELLPLLMNGQVSVNSDLWNANY